MLSRMIVVVVQIKNTDSIEEIRELITEGAECEPGYIISISISDGEPGHTLLAILIEDGVCPDGTLTVRKHILDNSICDIIRSCGENLEPTIIGAYRHTSQTPVSEEFFADNSDFLKVLKAVGSEIGIKEERIDDLYADTSKRERLISEWTSFIDTPESNFGGKSFLESLVSKYLIAG